MYDHLPLPLVELQSLSPNGTDGEEPDASTTNLVLFPSVTERPFLPDGNHGSVTPSGIPTIQRQRSVMPDQTSRLFQCDAAGYCREIVPKEIFQKDRAYASSASRSDVRGGHERPARYSPDPAQHTAIAAQLRNPRAVAVAGGPARPAAASGQWTSLTDAPRIDMALAAEGERLVAALCAQHRRSST